MLAITCPACNATLKLSAQPGKVRCPKCKAVCQADGSDRVATAPRGEPPPAATYRDMEQVCDSTFSKRLFAAWPVLAGGSAFVVAVVLLIVVLGSSSNIPLPTNDPPTPEKKPETEDKLDKNDAKSVSRWLIQNARKAHDLAGQGNHVIYHDALVEAWNNVNREFGKQTVVWQVPLKEIYINQVNPLLSFMNVPDRLSVCFTGDAKILREENGRFVRVERRFDNGPGIGAIYYLPQHLPVPRNHSKLRDGAPASACR